MMNLRIAAALIMASATGLAADPSPLGIQLWSLRNQLDADLAKGMAEVKALGFSVAESAGTYKHTPQEMRAIADANGVRIVGCHMPYERLQSDLAGAAAEAKALGASFIVVPWIPHPTDPVVFDVAQARVAAKNFNTWGAALAAAGLKLGYHTHGYEFRPLPDGSSAFDVLMKETDPKLVFFEMDVFWVVQPGQDPVQMLAKYPGRFNAFHIKDMRKGAPTHLYEGHAPATDEVPVGQGCIDWPALTAAGRKAGVEYWFIEDETTDPVGDIPTSVKYMESLGVRP